MQCLKQCFQEKQHELYPNLLQVSNELSLANLIAKRKKIQIFKLIFYRAISAKSNLPTTASK
jgi:hypothetical protein